MKMLGPYELIAYSIDSNLRYDGMHVNPTNIMFTFISWLTMDSMILKSNKDFHQKNYVKYIER